MKKIILIAAVFGFLISLNTVSAVTFNLIHGADRESIDFDKANFFERKVNLTLDKISLEVSEVKGKTIENVIVYLCKNLNPSDCITTKPIKYRRTVNTTFLKSDVLENDKGNFLIILEISINETTSWISDWFSVERDKVVDIKNYQVDVDLKTNLNDTKSTILDTGMIPFDFFNSMQFKGKNFYQISGSEKKENFIGKKSLDFFYNKLENSVKDLEGYSFIFPKDQNAFSPITVYNIEERCGDAVCGLGESYNSCWLDCRCPIGQIPGSSGCSNETLKLIIDEKPEKIKCISGENIESCSILPSNFSIKFHLENAPVNYRENDQYFRLGTNFISGQRMCLPDQTPKIQKIDNSTFILINNATNYTCRLPVAAIDHEDVGELTYSIYLSLSFETQNGTETREAAGQTTLNFYDILPNNFLGLKEKLEEAQDLPDAVKYTLLGAQLIGYAFDAHAVAQCSCCLSNFVCGLFSGYASCVSCDFNWKIALAIEGIIQTLKGGAAQCSGIYKPEAFGVPLGDEISIEGGSGRQAASAINPTCRKIKRSQSLIKQLVGESQIPQKLNLNEIIENLVWVNGESSGYATGSLCSNEKTQIMFTFEQFECNDLWFNLNSQERSVCNCNSKTFTKPTLLGDSCDCSKNTEAYTWIIDNQTQTAKQKYNTTDFHVLYNGSADKLFKNSDKLSITISCSSDLYGQITDTLDLATRKSVCEKVDESGINVFNPNSLKELST